MLPNGLTPEPAACLAHRRPRVARGRQYDDYLIFQNFDPKRVNSTGHRWRYDKKSADRSRRPWDRMPSLSSC